MAEYIEREAAMEIVKRTSGDYATAWVEIRRLPTADVAEVRHGEWIPISDGEGAECGRCGRYFNVSENGGMVVFQQFRKYYAFCPACGARMDGSAENEA